MLEMFVQCELSRLLNVNKDNVVNTLNISCELDCTVAVDAVDGLNFWE